MIYLRASKPYWFAIDPMNNDGVDAMIVCINNLPLKQDGLGTVKGEAIAIPLLDAAPRKNYDVYQDESIIVIAQSNQNLWPLKQRDKETFLQMYGNAYSEKLRNKTKTKLIEKLSSPSVAASSDNVLTAFREYTLFDGASVWLYNKETTTFTRIAGDVGTRTDYVSESQSQVLSRALKQDDILSQSIDDKFDVPDAVLTDHKWVNSFRVSVRTTSNNDEEMGIVAIVCLYSRYLNYNLRDTTRSLMRSFLQQNLARRYFDRLLRLNTLRGHMRQSINFENRQAFLMEVAKHICTDLAWESCSILIKSEDDSITLQTQYPYSRAKIAKGSKKSYNIDSNSMTADVVRQNNMLWSYDINSDPRNTHGVDDETTSPPKNWIGIPIASGGSTAIGVVRVKNKSVLSSDDDPNFSILDMHALQAVAGELASILHQSDLYRERKKLAEQRQKELSQLEDFLKTFRHEIRSPIQAVCFAPERIGLLMKEEFSISVDNVPKRFREFLLDFKATGNRLEMISKALTLDPEELVKEIQQNNLYKDCVAPVLAFVIPYAKKKGRPIIVDKDSLLINMPFDAVSLSMAFHVLMDNAVKYTDKDKLIKVFGSHLRDGHQIVVESRSNIFTMGQDDVKHFREKYYRGEKAKEQKLEGSGIGLYIADRIMALHNGELELLRTSKPVVFALSLKD